MALTIPDNLLVTRDVLADSLTRVDLDIARIRVTGEDIHHADPDGTWRQLNGTITVPIGANYRIEVARDHLQRWIDNDENPLLLASLRLQVIALINPARQRGLLTTYRGDAMDRPSSGLTPLDIQTLALPVRLGVAPGAWHFEQIQAAVADTLAGMGQPR